MEIKDLPQKYVEIWKEALPLLQEGRPGDDTHAKEVVEFILNYNKDKNLDLDVLIPLAIMHDIGHSAILPEHFIYISGLEKITNAKLVHMFAGAKIAKELLEKVNYNKEKSKEIVDIISVHDMDQIKGVDIEKIYNTETKRIFHDIDALDRYTETRFQSMLKINSDKRKIIDLLRGAIPMIFLEDFRKIASKQLDEIEAKELS